MNLRPAFAFLACALFGLSGCVRRAGAPEVVIHPLRLTPGQDLREEIDRYARERGIRAGAVLTCVGSLDRAALRMADRQETTTVEGKLEIVSLVGTFGEGGMHLHLSVSDGEGRTTGGHLKEGSAVYTTAEIVLAEFPRYRFAREVDPATTYEELKILRAGDGAAGER